MAFPYGIMVCNFNSVLDAGDVITPQASMTEIGTFQYIRQGGTNDFESGDTISHHFSWFASFWGGETLTIELYDIDNAAVVVSAAVTQIWQVGYGWWRGDSELFTLPSTLARVRPRYTLTGDRDGEFMSCAWWVRKTFG